MITRRSANKLLLAGLLSPALSNSRTKAAYHIKAPAAGRLGYSLYRFGWLPDGLVRYDSTIALQTLELEPLPLLPTSVDLRPQMPPVYDQHNIGSCTSNAVAACVQFVRRKENKPDDFRPSRLFIYYFGRLKNGAVATDSGLSIADAVSVLLDRGVPPEPDWQYDGTAPDSKNQFLPTSRAITPPRQSVLNEALQHKTTVAIKLGQNPDLQQLKRCLAQGYPFVFGFMIYNSFFDNNQEPPLPVAKIPVPPAQDTQIGGHATVAVGYSDDNSYGGGGYFICRNSWGLTDIADRNVQDMGHFTMPYAYTQAPSQDALTSDYWTIRNSI